MSKHTNPVKRQVAKEPVLSFVGLASVIVALLSVFNVVVDINTVQTIIVTVGPLVAALLARNQVTPTAR